MNETTDLTKYGVEEFTSEPVLGAFVTGRNVTYGTAWGGWYRGIKPSEWTGEPVHFFENGYIGETPQTCFTVLVAAVEVEHQSWCPAKDAGGDCECVCDRCAQPIVMSEYLVAYTCECRA